MASIEAVFRSLTGSLAGERLDAAAFAALTDDDLEATHKSIAAHVGETTKYAALSAAEIARRSDWALGQAGLARRKGHQSPEAMVQSLSGGSRVDSRRLVDVGTMMAEAQTAEQLAKHAADQAAEHPEWDLPAVALEAPWHAPLGDAVTAGRIGLDTAGYLRKGLGEPAADVTPDMLRDALTALIERCADVRTSDRGIAASQGLNAEQAFTAARHARDQIDETGIAARADAMRAAQYLRTWRKPNGMVHGDFELNPENGTFLLEVLGQLTGPRRGGPRFVDKERKARAQKIIDDPRSTDQIHAETLIELIHIAITADPGTVFSGSRPTARIVVQRSSTTHTNTDSHSATDSHNSTEGHSSTEGHGAIEGHPDPIPLTDIDRHLCAGFTAFAFDQGQVVDLGRENRLFSPAQKAALAVRDGGCLWPGCTKPPSWTEGHHINEWLAQNGLTNIADGVLLCKPDHLRLHNEGWKIKREGAATYWLIPPPGIDPDQTPIRLSSKSALHLGSPVTLPPADVGGRD
ncbi:HNH endonuclease signature motif containing protein [Cryobacterium tagatosivorans]|uniref:HNH endonuclease n=1 Tax=Cryobacterium tagatosivorans TaxID=1259199 RepID=A0A4R8UJ67_9MICO|nr:HNH endonuclease signature motif containing protein [Cryobacterium tagatosivorans]TFB55189.1 HNH endonuclease [Cryobacterium tagatosivorans]